MFSLGRVVPEMTNTAAGSIEYEQWNGRSVLVLEISPWDGGLSAFV